MLEVNNAGGKVFLPLESKSKKILNNGIIKIIISYNIAAEHFLN